MTRVDHVLVSVSDLDAAIASWSDAGLLAVVGGSHPGGTFNALVRGARPAYVELIGARDDATSAAGAQVLSRRGPLSWALAVDDVDQVRGALERRGYAPGSVEGGSRTTPAGETLSWRLCDVGPHVLHEFMPFLIDWETEMPPGPADGPVLTSLTLEVPDPRELAELLVACGLQQGPPAGAGEIALTDGEVDVVLRPGTGAITAMTVRLPGGPSGETVLDGLRVQRDARQ